MIKKGDIQFDPDEDFKPTTASHNQMKPKKAERSSEQKPK